MSASSLIQKISVQAMKTFMKVPLQTSTKFTENLGELLNSIDQVKTSDLNLDGRKLDSLEAWRKGGHVAPIVYIHIWEDEVFSMGVFVVRQGASLPLHDHPNMHGIIKVVHGTASISSYSVVSNSKYAVESHSRATQNAENYLKDDVTYDQDDNLEHFSTFGSDTIHVPATQVIKKAKLDSQVQVTQDCKPLLLTPDKGNIHRISSVDGAAAFLDILAPPYETEDSPRICHFYKEISTPGVAFDDPSMTFLRRIPQPVDFWGDSAKYTGPVINPREGLENNQ